MPDMPPAPPPEVHLTQLIFGKWVSMAVAVAAKLRLADKLIAGPKSVADLATETNTHTESLYRLMRALASVGVFTSDDAGKFALTPVGELLRSGVKGSMRGVADYCGSVWSWRAWEAAETSVRTGRTAFNEVFGEGCFDYLAKHPTEQAVFDEGMTGFSAAEADAVVAAYDFGGFGTLIDVGGGHGHLLGTILKKTPKLRGVVFDAQHVVAGAPARLAEMGVADRCQAEGGDFFKAIPAGGDAYILKHIIHDWNDADSGTILRNIRKVAKLGTKLLLVELVIPPGDVPHPGKLLDLEMLIVASGKERTEAEYAKLVADAGFRLTRIVPTQGPASVVEAEAV
jgi:O-methyltransferase domain